MKEGYWVNYRTGKSFPIDEHEIWLREPGNAARLGVPSRVVSAFGKFKPVKDRDNFLLFVMKNAPVMRVRGHGNFATFEYASRDAHDPMEAIWAWGRRNAGPFTALNIINFATGEKTETMYQDFEDAMDKWGPGGVMRAASVKRFSIKASVVRELLRISKELLGNPACRV